MESCEQREKAIRRITVTQAGKTIEMRLELQNASQEMSRRIEFAANVTHCTI
jgi:hypothetical protein